VAADPGRRAVLAATAVLPLLVAGCRGTQALQAPPQPAPDVSRLRGAIRAEEQTVARYQGAVRLLRDGPAAGTGSQPATIGVPHDPGMAHGTPAVSRARNQP